MHGKGVYNDSNTVELPRLEQPNQKGKSSDGGDISREDNQQIQVKEADEGSAVNDGISGASEVVVPLAEVKGEDEYGNDDQIADGVGSVAREASLNEIVVVEGGEEV